MGDEERFDPVQAVRCRRRCPSWFWSIGLLALFACGRGSFEPALTGARCGDGVVDGLERCDDGNTASGDGCAADCTLELCGNGQVEVGEACDDGNGDDDDGCKADCTRSCEMAGDCDDGLVCNGFESCTDFRCVSTAPLADGSDCPSGQCRAGRCAPASCGNGTVEGSEQCDDANTVSGDGCEADCTLTCSDNGDCRNGNLCDGAESCSNGMCVEGVAPAAGSECDRDDNTATRDICVDNGECRRSFCGDSVVDPGAMPPEECDDGNTDLDDGCNNNCQRGCGGLGAVCPAGTVCQGGICTRSMDASIDADAGTDADAGDAGDATVSCPPTPTTTSPVECFQGCAVDADCVSVSSSCCCDCDRGGNVVGINQAWRLQWGARELMRCGEASCLAVLCPIVCNCAASVTCVAGRCTTQGTDCGTTM
ncbi:MAG: DUF4215 domain-containing protein [Myxococcota bacterium]